jgi:hypothetical protein
MMDEHVKAYYAEKVAQELNPPKPPEPKMSMNFGFKVLKPDMLYTNCI